MRPRIAAVALAVAAAVVLQPPALLARQHEHHQQTTPPAQSKPPAKALETPAPTDGQNPHAGHQMPGMGAPASEQALRPMPMPPVDDLPSGPVVRLADLEQRVLATSPVVARAEADVGSARGRARQAGLYPNPTVGYTGEEVSFQDQIRGGQHGFFIGQTIVLGGKLRKRRDVLLGAVVEAEARLEAARFAGLTDLRLAYLELLAAERRFQVERHLVEVVDEAVRTSYGLFNAGQSDRPDVLEIEIEDQQARVGVDAARADVEKARAQLALSVGDPSLAIGRTDGKLEDALPRFDHAHLAEILEKSPDIAAARARVETADAAVRAARAERIPDLTLRGGFRDNRELLEPTARPIGWQGFLEVGVNIPIFDRNQGGIAAAEAELTAAHVDLRVVEYTIRSRFTTVVTRYELALRTSETYRTEILPRAEQAYRLYLDKYEQMTAAYPQVLIARRTWLQVNLDYIAALEQAFAASVPVQGLLVGGSGMLDAQGGFSAPLALPGRGGSEMDSQSTP